MALTVTSKGVVPNEQLHFPTRNCGAIMALLPSPPHFHPCAQPALCSMLMCFPKQKEPQPADLQICFCDLDGSKSICLVALFFFFFWECWDEKRHINSYKTCAEEPSRREELLGAVVPCTDTPSAELFPFSLFINSKENTTILFSPRFRPLLFTSESLCLLHITFHVPGKGRDWEINKDIIFHCT